MKPYQAKLRYSRQISEVLALSAGPLELAIDPSYVHNFAGLLFFNDAEGATPVQPSAGSATFTVALSVQPHVFQAVPDNALDVSVSDQVDWAGNTDRIMVTHADVVGATYWQLIWCGNSA